MSTSPTTYEHLSSTAILRAMLHQYQTYDEQVTFKNLDLAPVATKGSAFDFGSQVTPRALTLKRTSSL